MSRRVRLGALCAALAIAPAIRADEPGEPGEPELDRSPNLAGSVTLPLPVPERPFLLVDAARRFGTDEGAEVRVQLGENGRVSMAVFAVADPVALLAAPPPRQGLALARTPLGATAEALLAQSGALPRAGRGLTLVRTQDVALRVNHRSRRVGDETIVYDSNETDEDDVATVWVNVGGWSVQNVALGRLPAGLYLVRAHAGSWAATTMLSVGSLALLARRGDREDRVLVTDPEGAPAPGVAVESWAGARRVASAQTDARGEARLAAATDTRLRFVARRGDDVTWADVGHARLDTCDPRVYLAIGRPYYRPGETVYLRGHVRGCADGRERPLANEPVTLWPTRASSEPQTALVTVRSDAEGNFVATLVAHAAGIGAKVRGRTHQREVPLDTRALPQRALHVRLDRSWAAAGDVVEVRVEDDDGGWPREREVVLEGPTGRLRGTIGPRRAAVFRVRVPPTSVALARTTVTATIEADQRVTSAQASLWTGGQPEVVEIDAPRTWAAAGETFPVTLRAADLGGAPRGGPATVRLSPSDGNRATGAASWSGRVTFAADGTARAQIPLRGTGPWIVEVAKGGARGEVVVWDRPRPPQLSRRGPLAVQPRVTVARPGEPLAVDVRLPPGGGRAWVTLEQGGVWASELVAPGASGTASITLAVPEQARGMAAIVATAVHRGQVTTASTTVEVETSRAVELAVRTDKRTYDPGARAKVTIEARTPEGQPREGVASLWLADAGYWELGPEEYPTPTEIFRLPGRRAGAGDGTRPVSFGAEEGRVLDARLEWNGRPLPRASFRHAWGYGGDLVRVEARGTLDRVLDAFARAVGFTRADVCRELPRPGEVSLVAKDLPWDLVALRLADLLEVSVRGQGRVLRFECGGFGGEGMGTIGHGSGSGYGSGAGGLGLRAVREQSLEGTLFFAGSIRIGPDGRASLEVPLPDHPGRWRVEVTAIAADGGGASAGAEVHTATPVEAAIETATRLCPGDVTDAIVRVVARSLAGQTASLALALPAGLVAETALPATAPIPGSGRLELPIRLRAERPGTGAVVLRARVGTAEDAVRRTVDVVPSGASRPLAVRVPVGPEASVVRVEVPALTRPARVKIRVDDGIASSLGEALAAVREPRWRAAIVHVDRLATLRALERAARALPDRTLRDRTLADLGREITGESERLAMLRAADGTWAIWSHLPSSHVLTAETLYHLGATARGAGFRRTWDALRRAARTAGPTIEPYPAAVLAAALAEGGGDQGAAAARALLPRVTTGAAGDLALETDTWALAAARALGEQSLARTIGTRLAAAVERSLGRPPAFRCAGPSFWLCFARWGEGGTVLRAARALVDARHPGAIALGARTSRWIAEHPFERGLWTWYGTDRAEALALVASLGEARPGGAGRFGVEIDGRPATWADAPAERIVEVRAAGTIVVRLAAAPGRAALVRVDSALEIAPPARTEGPAGLAREFLTDGGRHEVEVAFDLPRATDRVEVVVPLPAGLSLGREPASASREPTGLFAEWSFRLDALRGAATDTTPSIEEIDGALHLRWRRLPPGRHRQRVGLVAVAPGRYGAGPAWLRTAEAATWAVTPAATVTVAP